MRHKLALGKEDEEVEEREKGDWSVASFRACYFRKELRNMLSSRLGNVSVYI